MLVFEPTLTRRRLYEVTGAPLLLNFAPKIIARTAVRTRTIVEKAFIKYYKNGGLDQASVLAKARAAPPSTYGLSIEESARLEVPLLFAVLSSSVPAAFWTLSQIHAKRDLLSELRGEISSVISIDDNEGPPSKRFTVSIERLKTQCPLLSSVYQEILRTRTFQSTIRMVLEDTLIDGKYLLKKNSMVLVPNNVIHASPTAWGPTALASDFYRFMPEKAPSVKHTRHAFRSFGGAPNLCPGRHFATTEILATLGTLLMRYDISPRKGEWRLPDSELAVFAAISPPKWDVEVELKPRQGWQGKWVFEVGDPTVKPALVCG